LRRESLSLVCGELNEPVVFLLLRAADEVPNRAELLCAPFVLCRFGQVVEQHAVFIRLGQEGELTAAEIAADQRLSERWLLREYR
jgi:hypothetical protein